MGSASFPSVMVMADTVEAGRFGRVRAFRARVRRTASGRLAWRIAITVLGGVIIAGGIVLLPLPGPGWLIIFAGLGLLATEYEWARRLLQYAKARVAQWTAWISSRGPGTKALAGLAGLILLAALVAAAWWAYGR